MQDSRHSNTGLVRILFVDDSKLIRFAGKRFPGSEFDVILAADGRESWQLLQHDRGIAAVIADLNMPRLPCRESA